LKRLLNDQAGNIAVSMAIVALPLLVSAGAAMDFARANHVRTVLQNAADAAALAGATNQDKSDAALTLIVSQYLDANGANDALRFVSKIEQKTDKTKGTFSVTIAGKIDTGLMAVTGLADMDVHAFSEVNLGSQALELALVLDNTGSMSGSKIANLKSAANNLIDILKQESSDYAETKIAVVPFAEYVNVGPSRLGESWINAATLGGQPFTGCVGSRSSPSDLQAGASGEAYPAIANQPCNVELLPLTSNISAVKSRISAMVSTGYTYIPTGLLWGWNVLDSDAPFTEGRTKAALQELKGRKVIVLMTDGENTISPTYPTHDGFDVASSNAKLTELCGKVKDDSIEIYTVSFMVPTDTIKDILTACASDPQKYFDADNSAELSSAFAQIGRDLSAIRLTN
jgi:Flp pilus assembly protein TadG